MPARKYTEQNIKEWVEYYNKVFCIGEVSRYFGIHKSLISKYFTKYKEQFNFQYIEEIQTDLFKKDKRLCLPLTGCGQIKNINEFYFRADSQKYKEQCKECRLEYDKQWKEKNKQSIVKYQINYGKKNRKRLSAYEKERRYYDIQFKLIKNIRSRIANALSGKIKHATCMEYLGCNPYQLMKHLQNQFYPHKKTGEIMTWENYSYDGWHIDHIKPLISFDLTDRTQLLKAGHFTNLQPLWAEENFAKSDKILELK